MHDAVMACPKDTAWIVATGALTNIALLTSIFPETASHVRGLSIMGGAIGDRFTSVNLGPSFRDETGKMRDRIGNQTPYAEFNIWCDPEAARSLFSNPILACKTTMIPLDVTHQAFATADVRTLLLHGQDRDATPTRLRQMFFDLLVYFQSTYEEVFDLREGPPVHDPLAAAILLLDHPDQDARINFHDNSGERWQVEVELGGEEFARTKATKAMGGEEGVRIPRSLDVSKFWQVLNHCMSLADAQLRSEK